MKLAQGSLSFVAWLAGLSLAAPALAVDGVVEINQVSAAHGGVTPGDAPGFPVTLSAAGSYRLTGNLSNPDYGTSIIEIGADDVTIDLNGFRVGHCPDGGFCFPGAANGIDGSGFTGLHLHGGTVMGSQGTCIHFTGRASLRDLEVEGCATGIDVGDGSRVQAVRVAGSTGEGIQLGRGGLLEDSTVVGSGATAVRVVFSALLTNTVIQGNVGAVISGGAAVWTGGGYRGCLITENNGTSEVQPISVIVQDLGGNICGSDSVCP